MEEYICKRSLREKPMTIRLFDSHLEWQQGERTGKMEYSQITNLQLSRSKKEYTIRIVTHEKPIALSNFFYLKYERPENRLRQYITFVRVLHYYLRDYQNIKYSIGSWREMVWIFGVIILLFVLIQLALLQFVSLLPIFIGVDIFLLIVALLLAFRFRPKPYHVNEIPANYLPINS